MTDGGVMDKSFNIFDSVYWPVTAVELSGHEELDMRSDCKRGNKSDS